MYIDIVLILFALYGLWVGFRKGFIRTLFSLLLVIVGLLLTLKLSPWVVEMIRDSIAMDKLISLIIGVLLCYLVVTLILRWVGKNVDKMLRKAKLNLVSKLLGGILLGLLMVLSYSVIIWFLDQTQLISDHQRMTSKTYAFLMDVPSRLQAFLLEFKPLFQDFWDMIEDIINDRSE